MSTPRDQVVAWLESVIDVDCRSGLYDEATILDAVREIIEMELGAFDAVLFEQCAARTRAGLAACARDEQTWASRTSNDRLESAFSDLEARGIVTGQAVGFTIQEGAALIDAIVVERGGARGSVFFHRQDLERAIAGGGLALAFTAYDAEVGEPTIAIGREVVAVLAHHGLGTQWDGTGRSRIVVTPFVWQRRRSTRAPAGPGPAPTVAQERALTPPPRAVCSRCGGKGWVQKDAASFPEPCACKRGG